MNKMFAGNLSPGTSGYKHEKIDSICTHFGRSGHWHESTADLTATDHKALFTGKIADSVAGRG